MLLHVVDAASEVAAAQSETVLQTLATLGLSETPVLTVLNKVDGLTLPDGRAPESEADLPALVLSNPAPGGEGTVPVSALRGWGIDACAVASPTTCWAWGSRRSRRAARA